MSNTGEIRSELLTLENKYRNLVWYGENPESSFDHPGEREFASEITRAYPNEVSSLHCPEHGEWCDGFNNGMLAAIRFIHDSYKYDVDKAYELFPHLSAG